MGPTAIGVVMGFFVLLAVFRGLEFLRDRDRRLPVFRRGFRTDIIYWLFTPLVTRTVRTVAIVLVAVPVTLVAYGEVDFERLKDGFGPLARLPFWVQALAILVIGDFIGYWMHRLFHGRRLWKFHAIHHSSVDLDWLSSVRLHPVNDVLMRIASTLPLLALGFAPVAAAGIVPVLTLFAILLHANVDWDWGPLRAVVASPRFHRWHHTDETAARDKNFAGLLPVWDVLFGTWYMPKDRMPSSFGTETPVPEGILGQMAFPFRRDRGRDRETPEPASRRHQA